MAAAWCLNQAALLSGADGAHGLALVLNVCVKQHETRSGWDGVNVMMGPRRWMGVEVMKGPRRWMGDNVMKGTRQWMGMKVMKGTRKWMGVKVSAGNEASGWV